MGGETLADMLTNAPTAVDPRYDIHANANIVCILGGINDLFSGASANIVYDNLKSYWAGRRLAGFKVMAGTVQPAATVTGAGETARVALNVLIRSDASLYDGLADFAANAHLQNTSDLTYYQADGVHPTATGAAVMASIADAVIATLL